MCCDVIRFITERVLVITILLAGNSLFLSIHPVKPSPYTLSHLPNPLQQIPSIPSLSSSPPPSPSPSPPITLTLSPLTLTLSPHHPHPLPPSPSPSPPITLTLSPHHPHPLPPSPSPSSHHPTSSPHHNRRPRCLTHAVPVCRRRLICDDYTSNCAGRDNNSHKGCLVRCVRPCQ